jgi:hypothetical protein
MDIVHVQSFVMAMAESDEGRRVCGEENEAPCLRPEEDIKHSRSEQVAALMDPKRPLEAVPLFLK